MTEDSASSICYFNPTLIFLIITSLHDVSSRKPHPSEAIFTIHEVLGILDNAHRSFVTTETVGLKE